MEQRNKNAPQILSASSNLLGLCFVVITSIKFLKLGEKSLIEEITGASFVIFMLSCILAFLSMRSTTKRAETYETYADYSFLFGLILIFIMTILFTFGIFE